MPRVIISKEVHEKIEELAIGTLDDSDTIFHADGSIEILVEDDIYEAITVEGKDHDTVLRELLGVQEKKLH